ncbi:MULTISPECIES: response regulator transcription factor [Oscillospiraceae]|uniref:Heme response regulator HssR n=1 Tax=Harryflintia acetispora TaxID=1849041 RepID=A0A9X8Y8R7_9FIRM|nr:MULTISPECIES: response regulator transcription factor [Oscillospiraceae]RGB69692.1 DNA-binding response regulator [Harryflintia acetispora]TCL44517.1 DNA-binding response OmpR family regulator [Harryflintia acetispora]
MFTVLAATGDETLAKRLYESLEDGGYHCFPAQDGEKVYFLLDNFHIDLLVCEAALPGKDGCTITRELRAAQFSLPILLLAGENSLEQKRACFLAGADDCMPKPVEMEELLLRVSALLRRAGAASRHKLQIGELAADYDTLTVSTPDRNMKLPKREFELLFKLLSSPGQTFTRRQLLDELWGLDTGVDERTVDVHIKRLRARFKYRQEFQLVTVRGIGYRAKLTR